MTTRIVSTAYLGLLVLATGCDGWTTPSGPPASLDAAPMYSEPGMCACAKRTWEPIWITSGLSLPEV